MRSFRRSFVCSFCLAVLVVALALVARYPAPVCAASASLRFPAFGYIEDNPTATIAGSSATTTATATEGATTAQVQWVFGTVAGSYGTCTVQAKTTFDGINWLTLGSAASITVTTSTVNAWEVMSQAATTSVTTTTPSSSAAVGFGKQTEYTFSCSGGYGTAAPVTVTTIYK